MLHPVNPHSRPCR